MKNRRMLDFVLATALLSMTVLTVGILFVSAIEWSTETRLTTDTERDWSPSIMQAGDGTIWVVWQSNRFGVLNDKLLYKTSSNYGSTWSSDKALTAASGYDSEPSIMQARNGTIWVVWSSLRTGNYELFYKTSSNNGASWSGDTQLTTDTSRDVSPSIMQSTNGTIWVVWSSNRKGDSELFYKTYTGSSWSTEWQLTYDSSYDENPSIMQARNGTIWVVWSSYRTGNYELFYKTFNGITWSSDTQLTDAPKFYDEVPWIAQDIYGTIWVVWQSDRAPNALEDLYYRVYDGSSWSPADIQLTTDEMSDIHASIAQISDGKIWIVWASDRDGNFNIYYKTAQVKIPGDINSDGTVNDQDLILLNQAFGSTGGPPPSANWNPDADLNKDNIIDVQDLLLLSKNYGRTA